jgi:resuscitation-promoting factor RpfA
MPHQASKSEQIAVAERVLAKQGWNAWPSCSRKTGVRGHTADTSGASSTVRASAPAPAASGGNYTVKAGDTLSKIAAAHGKSWQQLAAQNGLSNPNALKVGQKLAV